MLLARCRECGEHGVIVDGAEDCSGRRERAERFGGRVVAHCIPHFGSRARVGTYLIGAVTNAEESGEAAQGRPLPHLTAPKRLRTVFAASADTRLAGTPSSIIALRSSAASSRNSLPA